jgi:Putative silver efflux pump
MIINALMRFSIRNRFLVVIMGLMLIVAGVYNAYHLPIDAVPDITNRQVQINVKAPALAPTEVERQITFPVRKWRFPVMPGLVETRSISQFGLSQVTAIFEDSTDITSPANWC